MLQPQNYGSTLACMIGSMLCWGSWANSKKIVPRFPFQLFYWDYCLGVLSASLLFGLTAGSIGAGQPFLLNLRQADGAHLSLAVVAGVIFNIANLLLVAAIDLAGMAVAFPVGIGLALVVGVLLNYLLERTGDPLFLFGGLLLVALAIVADAVAYRMRERERPEVNRRGLWLALTAGLLMGLFYPFVTRAIHGEHALSAYSVNFVFSVSVMLCALVVNTWWMRHPLAGGAPVAGKAYRDAPAQVHWPGILGGTVWSGGAILSFVASGVHVVGPAVSYAIGQGATMVSALWGVFVWREFSGSSARTKRLLACMFALFLAGLGVIAYAPVVHAR